jgi:hypothetical protein
LAKPGVCPTGTVITTCVSLQLTTGTGCVLNSQTSPCPWVAPNPLPVNVTCIPGDRLVDDMLVSTGGIIVKLIPLLSTPF